MLGGSSNKTWETVIKHAKDCVLDDKLYMYRSSEDGVGLLLDSVLTVVGATFDGQNYQPLDQLSVYQMVCTSYHIFTSFLVICTYRCCDVWCSKLM